MKRPRARRDLGVFGRLGRRAQLDVRLNPEGATGTTLTCDDSVLDVIDTAVSGEVTMSTSGSGQVIDE